MARLSAWARTWCRSASLQRIIFASVLILWCFSYLSFRAAPTRRDSRRGFVQPAVRLAHPTVKAKAAPKVGRLPSAQTPPKSAVCTVEFDSLTHPGLDILVARNLSYPLDALQHFEEIHASIRQWLHPNRHCYAGFCGPWIENVWIKTGKGAAIDCKRPGGKHLSDTFGPFIPLFVPWTDLRLENKHTFPPKFLARLLGLLRKDVAYTTVVQHDTGLTDGYKCVGALHRLPNLLIFSAGGFGHVPIPLTKAPMAPVEQTAAHSIDSRQYFVSFMGKLATNEKVRKSMAAAVSRVAEQANVKTNVSISPNWQEVTRDSRLALSPRGFGRSSFRTTEIWQLGCIPVYVWDDVEWVPYWWMKDEIMFSAHISQFEELLFNLTTMAPATLDAMETRIRRMRDSHFTPEGIVQQILRFLVCKQSDLAAHSHPRCPNTEECKAECMAPGHQL